MIEKIKQQVNAMYYLIRYASQKILFDKKIVISFVIAILCATIMGYSATQGLDTITDGANLLDQLMLSFFLPIITMLYGSSIIREEIEDKSITMMLVSPLHRILIYFCYYIAVTFTVSLFMIGITTTGVTTFFGLIDFSNDAIVLYRDIMLLSVVGTFVYSALYLLVSLLTEHPLYFGLPYAFLWEWLIASFPGTIHKVTLKHYLRSIGQEWIQIGSIASYNASSYWHTIIILLSITLGFFLIGGFLFMRKELT